MKSDVDRLMTDAGIDGLWITGQLSHNAAARYFVGSAHLTVIDILKPAGRAPVLFHGPMEREEASATGLQARTRAHHDWQDYLGRADNNSLRAYGLRLADEFRQLALDQARVAVYGRAEVDQFLAIKRTLLQELPHLQLLPSGEDQDVLAIARQTKDASEIAEIESVGARTIEVVDRVRSYLSEQAVREGWLVDRAGNPLTVGAVKSRIHLWLAEQGLESAEGVIFAPGREAAFPHSDGEDESRIPIGKSIIFDIYPRPIGGGYFFDFTRTWCLGSAEDDVQQAHEDVLRTAEHLRDRMRAGVDTQDLQIEADRLLEEAGHPTRLSSPETTAGFFHGLGHGVGLQVHEAPWFDEQGSRTAALESRMVITLEPGVYYPERGFGIRIEDTLMIGDVGPARVLAPYPTDLILPLKDSAKRIAS